MGHQKSKTQWIQDGDRNTKFYHTKTIAHRKKNRIKMLRDHKGRWVDEAKEIRRLILNFYKTLFKEGN